MMGAQTKENEMFYAIMNDDNVILASMTVEPVLSEAAIEAGLRAVCITNVDTPVEGA